MGRRSVGNLVAELRMGIGRLQSDVAQASGEFRKLGTQATQIGRAMLPVTAALTGIGFAAASAANSVQKGMAEIRTGTGATGDELKALGEDFRVVFKGVPQSAETVGKAIADVRTRLHLTGEPLQAMTRQFLDLARITKTDVSTAIAGTTRVFGDWSIQTDKQSDSLDFLFRVSQATGAGIDQISRQVVQFGAPLRQMGFDFETAAALMGKFEKEGVNTELVMGSLRIALTNMARAGVTDAGAALEQISNQIKAAGSAAEANAIALKVFGSRAGPDMAAAIREGRFELGDFVAQMKAGTDTIAAAAADAKTLADRWGELRNRMTLALEPLGAKMIDIFERQLMPILERTISFIESLIGWFGKLPGPVQTGVVAIGALAAALPVVLLAFGQLSFALSGMIKLFPLLQGGAVASAGGMKTLAASMNLNTSSAGLLRGGIIGLTVALAGMGFASAASDIAETARGQRDLNTVIKAQSQLWDENSSVLTNVANILTGPMVNALTSVTRAIEMGRLAWVAWREDGLRGVIDAATGVTSATQRMAEEVRVTSTSFAEGTIAASRHAQAMGDVEARLAPIQPQYQALRQELQAGKITQEEYNAKLKELLDGIDRVAPKTTVATNALGNLAQGNDEAARAAKSLQEELKRLDDNMQAALAPTVSLEAEIRNLMDRGFKQHEIIAVYGDRIIRATQEQRELNVRLKESARPLTEFMEGMDKAARSARGATLATQDFARELKSLPNPVREYTSVIRTNINTTGLMSQRTLEAEKRLREMKLEAERTSRSVAELSARGMTNAEIMAVMGSEINRAREASELFPGVLNKTTESLIRQQKQTEESTRAAKQWEDAWSHAMGQVVADFSKGVTDMIFHGEKMSIDLKGIFTELGKSLVRILIQELFDPVMQLMSQLGRQISQWILGSLGLPTGGGGGPGGGGGVGIPGGLPAFNLKALGGVGVVAGGAFGGGWLGEKIGGEKGRAVGTIAGGIGGAFLAGKLGLFGGAAGTGGAAGGVAGAAGGIGGSLAALGPLLTNPITAAVAAAVVGGLIIRGRIMDPVRKAGIEIGKDFGIEISKNAISGFLKTIETKSALNRVNPLNSSCLIQSIGDQLWRLLEVVDRASSEEMDIAHRAVEEVAAPKPISEWTCDPSAVLRVQ